MASEKRRFCGYRIVGGLYLTGKGNDFECEMLPYELEICPVCGGGIKQSRGWTWLKGNEFFDVSKCDKLEECGKKCPFSKQEEVALLWIGTKFYTPEEFAKEILKMGISKRIPTISKRLKLGETYVFFAHPEGKTKTVGKGKKAKKVKVPAIFYGFVPTKIEMPLYKSYVTDEVVEKLAKKGVTVVKIKDNDKDHAPSEANLRRIKKLLGEEEFEKIEQKTKPSKLTDF